MTDSKNGKGFSGFDDLVSDISKDVERTGAVVNNQSPTTQPVNESPSKESADHATPSDAQEDEEFIALLKSVVNENKLDTIPSEDLLVIYERALSIDASSEKLDSELFWAINTLQEEIQNRRLPYPSTGRTSTPSSVGLPSGSGGGSGLKWVIGIIIVLIAISFLNQETEKKGNNTYVPRPERATTPAPAPAPPEKPAVTQQARSQPKTTPTSRKERTDIARTAPAPAPSPVLPQTISTPKEIKPSVGTNNILGRDEIRYCLSESIRMAAMKEEVNLYVEAEVDRFNATVQDYNSRCGQFRYRQGSLESVRREVDAQKTRLEMEGTLRIKNMRRNSSSTRVREPSAQQANQELTTRRQESSVNQPSQQRTSHSPTLNDLSNAERSSIESACGYDKRMNGPAAYNDCVSQQLAALRSSPRNIDLSGLSQAERSSIESACGYDKRMNGPAAYNRCVQGQLARLRR